MPAIVEIKIEIGKDAHGRKLTATRYTNAGRPMWKLEAEPSSQQDDGERMWSLTDQNLEDLVKARDLVK